ncbi:MAG TPA: ribosome assembly cofactor RimP [Flavobacteriaceae bacterium]|nr:ribosome assembly cofactor RimP [Flavobacteriaceae bacterium]
MLEEKVKQLLQDALDENPSLFLIDLKIDSSNKIQVILDGDSGVSLNDCIAVSRAIEHNLDREEEDFALEVMSAGASEPLILPRQFQKNVGRTLAAKTKSGEKFEGELTQASGNTIKLEWKTREPKPVGKGKVTINKEAMISLEDIAKAKVKINFN